jgi:hypothetical protein
VSGAAVPAMEKDVFGADVRFYLYDIEGFTGFSD